MYVVDNNLPFFSPCKSLPMQVQVSIPLLIHGVADLESSKERAPCVRLFLSTNVSRTQITIPLSDTATPVAFRFKVNMPADSNEQEMRRKITDALSKCTLNLCGITQVLSPLKEWTRKNAGDGDIMLIELFSMKPQQPVEIPLSVAYAGDNYTPKMRLVVANMGPITINATPVSLVGVPAEVKKARDAQRDRDSELLRSYMYACHHLFTQLKPTWQAVSRINCYIYMLRNKMVIPSLGYLMQTTPPVVDVEYFENALALVLKRERMCVDELLALPDTDRRVCNIMMQMLMMYTNWAMYIGDLAYLHLMHPHVRSLIERLMHGSDSGGSEDPPADVEPLKQVDLEEFEVVELYGCDDCEGLGSKIMRDALYLLSLAPNKCSKELQKMQRVRRHYMMFLMLCGVTTGDIAGDFKALGGKDTRLGAHMFCMAIPMARAIELIEKCNVAKPVFRNMNLEREFTTIESAKLPMMMGEGTGLLAPLPIELPERLRLVLPQRAPVLTQMMLVKQLGTDVPRIAVSLEEEPIVMEQNHGCAHFPETGSSNPAFTNNSLWLTNTLLSIFPDAFRGVRRWFHCCEQGDPHFYRTWQKAFTLDPLRLGYPVASFVPVRRCSSDPEPRWTVGVTTREFAAAVAGRQAAPDVTIGLWAEPAIEDDEALAIKRQMFDAPPVPPILAPPKSPGENNMYWDPTALVPSAQDYNRIHASLRTLQTTCAATALRSLINLHYMCGDTPDVRILGSLGFDESNEFAIQALRSNFKLLNDMQNLCPTLTNTPQVLSVEQVLSTFLQRFRSHKNRVDDLPVVATFGVNRQQMLRDERVAAMNRALQQQVVYRTASSQSRCVVFMPMSLHVNAEQVTADTGGYMLQIYGLLIY